MNPSRSHHRPCTDYGAIWSGCLGSSAKPFIPVDQLAAHCFASGLPMDLAAYFFEPGEAALVWQPSLILHIIPSIPYACRDKMGPLERVL